MGDGQTVGGEKVTAEMLLIKDEYTVYHLLPVNPEELHIFAYIMHSSVLIVL